MESMAPIMNMKKAYLVELLAVSSQGNFPNPKSLVAYAARKHLTNINLKIEDINTVLRELDRDSYIHFNNGRYFLTSKGVKQAIRPIKNIQLPFNDLTPLICSQYKLMRAVNDDYRAGNFGDAVFNSFRHLEERVRNKADLTEKSYGKPLMGAAFNSKSGKLRHPKAKIDEEPDSLCELMRGAIGFFKNPSSHRTVDIEDPNIAISIIHFAKMLLDIVDECELIR